MNMFVVTLGKVLKRTLMGLVIIAILAIVTVQVVNYQRDKEPTQVKVDRSNAMQVTKPIDEKLVMTIPDFFTEYRLERDRVRSERSDLLREVLRSAKTEEARVKAQDAVLKLALEKQRESEMENLIKARGFADALVFVRDSSVSAVVKAQTLNREEVIQVADVIGRVSGVKPEDITISAKP
jgi:stage III sporulation protein AH